MIDTRELRDFADRYEARVKRNMAAEGLPELGAMAAEPANLRHYVADTPTKIVDVRAASAVFKTFGDEKMSNALRNHGPRGSGLDPTNIVAPGGSAHLLWLKETDVEFPESLMGGGGGLARLDSPIQEVSSATRLASAPVTCTPNAMGRVAWRDMLSSCTTRPMSCICWTISAARRPPSASDAYELTLTTRRRSAAKKASTNVIGGAMSRSAAWISNLAARSSASAVCLSSVAVICPLMLFTLNCVGISNASAATSKMAETEPPFFLQVGSDMNQGVHSWINSPRHPNATSPDRTYSNISQQDCDSVNAAMSAAEAMESYSNRQNIAANILFIFFGGLLAALVGNALIKHFNTDS